MGVLRLFLAFLVVFDHMRAIGPTGVSVPIYGAVLAVKLFFAISGFYMALVLDGKYHSTASFYINRIWRLAPTYFFVVFLVAVVQPSLEAGRLYFMHSGSLRDLVLNLVVIGQDVMPWTCYKDGISICAKGTPVASYVPQMWSVGIELELYLLAPLLVLRRLAFIAALAISIGFYVFLLTTDNYREPWNRMVMPGQLLFFCLGMLSFRVYKAISGVSLPRFIGVIALAGALGVAGYEALWGPFRAPSFKHDMIIVTAFIAFLPFVFHWTRKSSSDEFLGSLSYPMYVCHLFVLFGIARSSFIETAPFNDYFVRLTIYLGLVSVTSIFITVIVERPFERLRHRWQTKARGSASPPVVHQGEPSQGMTKPPARPLGSESPG